MTNQYTHNICCKCWQDKYPERKPIKLKIPLYKICCFCGVFNSDGIFTRVGPKSKCEGEHYDI